MPMELRKIQEAGRYEVLGLKDEKGADCLLFVRFSGAPQALIIETIQEAADTAAIMDRVRQVYRHKIDFVPASDAHLSELNAVAGSV